MVVNWILPVRGVQAVLSVVVLGLMAYGKFSIIFCQRYVAVQEQTCDRTSY